MSNLVIAAALLVALLPGAGLAQDPADAQPARVDEQAAAPSLCGVPVPPPAQLPPADSGPVVYYMGLCFSAQGDTSATEPETYLHHIRLRGSVPSQGQWVPYDDDAFDTAREDFKRLWATNFLDDLTIEATDYTFSNGVVGKLVTYHLEERARVKIVSYEGSRKVDRTKIDETLRERGIELRLDSFLDERTLTRVKRIVRDLAAEQGFTNVAVTHTITPVAGGPKLVNVTFRIDEGPKIAIRDIDFIGNRVVSDATLERTLKHNRAQGLLSPMTGAGSYNEIKFADDAQNIEEYYRNHGYISARVGPPELRALDDSPDGTTRWVQLRIPVTEGQRYATGTITFEGNQRVSADQLRALVNLQEGDWYAQSAIRVALEKAREIYGAAGYMEFTGFPDLRPREDGATGVEESGTVDVIVRVTEGAQYFVNRITFAGNTITRDRVIRRELRLVEGGTFNTEALKLSVRRLNQLGYFKAVEGTEKDLRVEKTVGRDNAVDITLTLQEENRNQLQFGAGLSQYEGVFGNLSYTTSNFLGRGESLTLTGQRGARSSVYQLAFTEPYVLDQPITAGLELFSRKVDFLTGTNVVGYSEVRSGVNLTGGRPLFQFSRVFMTYGYEVVDTAVSDDLDAEGGVGVPVFNPFLDEGRHIESRVTPSFIHNTVDHPFTPRSGRRLTLNMPVAGGFFGGTTNYVRPELDVVLYVPHTRRTALGLRANAGWVRPFGNARALPYYLRYFLGGEYQIRGVDIRTVGPTDAQNRALGGDRFVLFNAEYYLDLFGSVRALLFHDAGQAFSETQRLDLRQLRTSSGAELRVVLPVLNVPFRLIYAWNTYRDVFQPARALKFAVGTTF